MDILKKIGSIVSKYPKAEIEFASCIDELNTYLPMAKAMFSMGSQSLEELQEAGYVAKNRKVTGLRNQVLSVTGTPLLVSYSPSIGEVDYGKFVDLLTDTAMALRLATTGTTKPQYGDYQYVSDLSSVVSAVKALIAENGSAELAFDTETLGLDRFSLTGYIVGLQFTYAKGTGSMVVHTSREESHKWLWDMQNQADLNWLLTCPEISVRAANGKYDLEWLYEHSGITCTNFKFDTTLVGSLLDENRSNALDVHVKIYAPSLGGYSDEFDATANKARMDLEYLKSPENFLKYSAGDSDGTFQVATAQKTELLKDPALTSFYVNVLHPSARAFELVERGGVVLDKKAIDILGADLLAETHSLITKGKSIIGGILSAKHYDEKKAGGINLTKASLIKDFMFSPAGLNLKPRMLTSGGPNGDKKKEPSTAMEHLEMFKDVPEAKEFVSLMSDFSSVSKTLGTYVLGFQKHLRSDGRFHPSYWMHKGNRDDGDGGTTTGRLSVTDPAFQTVPKHTHWGKRIRQCFSAPDGMLVLENDYSQGELKVMACLAFEDAMIASYLEGRDLHVVTSGSVAGLSYDQMMALKKSDKDKYDGIRQLGKAGNFGLIYGMGVDGFMEYARVSYGVILTREEAEAFRNGFFAKYPQLVVYHQQYKAFANKHGYVRGPLGRIRHLPLIRSQMQSVRALEERRAINSPVQGTLSDMMIWAIAEQASMGWFDTAPCFGAIHDACYTYCPEDNYEFYASRVVQVMETLPFHKVGWTPQLKFTADCKFGKNMGDLKELSINRTW